ncbi:exported hypothetical protein [Pseudomonas sp. IT-P253]
MLSIIWLCQFATAAVLVAKTNAAGTVLAPLFQLLSSVGSKWNPLADLVPNGPPKGPEPDIQYSRLWLSTSIQT